MQAASNFSTRFDAQLVVQRLDFFRADAGNFQHLDQARRNGGLQFVVVGQLAGVTQFGDFFLERFADALDFAQAIFGDEFVQRFGAGLERARGVDVGAGFERVFALQFQQGADLRQNFRNLIFCHFR